MDEPAPDHSSLTVFKNRYLKPGKGDLLMACFDEIIQQAVAQGLELGDLQILDSVHTEANVNAEKDKKRQAVNKGRRAEKLKPVYTSLPWV
ncbi:MAG: hypothetical protein U9R48_11355 [Chloroflexota bacterium]|nr:hypothetical protein [Chloroflexota bacterium]